LRDSSKGIAAPCQYSRHLLTADLERLLALEIGFVFSNWVFNPQKIWGLNNIGFVWVCFHQVSNPIYFSYLLVIIDFALIFATGRLGLFFQIKLNFSLFSTLFHLFFSLFCLFPLRFHSGLQLDLSFIIYH